MGCSTKYLPYGSIVSAFLVYCGMGLFCGASLTALNITEEMFMKTGLNWEPVISALRIIVYTVTPAMVVIAFIYIMLGYAATKQSKVQVYDDEDVCCGGMGCVSLAVYILYLVNFIWLVVCGAGAIPVIFTYMVNMYTKDAADRPFPNNLCVDLKMYGFAHAGDNTTICGVTLDNFGELAGEAFVMYCILLGGCALALLGLIHLLMCLSANWGHIKDGLKRRDYESRRRLEEAELHDMGPRTSMSTHGPRAKVYDTSMSQVAYNPQLPPIGGFGEHQAAHRHPSQPTLSTERLVNDYY